MSKGAGLFPLFSLSEKNLKKTLDFLGVQVYTCIKFKQHEPAAEGRRQKEESMKNQINVAPKRVITRTFAYLDKRFALVELSNGQYGAIDHDYIENGKTTKALNGGELYMAETIEGVIDNVKFRIDFAKKLASGKSIEEIAQEMIAQ